VPADPGIARLRAFLLVAESGSYRAAAVRAFRSQPAISLAIRELESRLGAPLFEPGARTRLTPFGERCLPLARELIRQHDRLSEAMTRLGRPEEGTLALAVLPSVASQWLPELVKRYTERHPGVNVRVLDDNTRNIQARVASGEADFGICSLGELGPDLDAMPLIRDDFGLVCRRDHPLAAHAGALAWRVLAGFPVLGNLTHVLLGGTGAARYVAEPRVFVSNMTSLISLLERGLGVSPLPALAFPRARSDLVWRRLVQPVVERSIGIVRLRGRSLTPAAVAMEAMVVAFFRERGPLLDGAPMPARSNPSRAAAATRPAQMSRGR